MSEMSSAIGEAPAAGAGPADFVALLKPRVMSLVCFTGLAGMLLAPGSLHPVIAFTALLCMAVGAGAAAAINMWCDRDIDALMARTRARPIPAGRVAAADALGFGVTLAVGAVATMGLAVNWTAAALLALTIAFYVFVYTMWLKRRTPQNIVIGGAAGALPPVIGWAAMSGSVTLEPMLLFLIIFLWTPPHFWALAILKAEEYGRAGVPMMPNIAGPASTRRQIFVYALAVAACALLPAALGFAGIAYGVAAALLGLEFLRRAWRLLRADRDLAPARRLFGYSIFYLFAIFAALLIERLLVPATGVAS
ncbi:MAG TPA: heme o synthase [Alphaproteobacteria bacterium]